MASIQFDLKDILEIPRVELDRADRLIFERCDTYPARTAAYLFFSVFAKLTGGCGIQEIKSTSGGMGEKDLYLHLEHGSYLLRMRYSQSLNDSWQSVNVNSFERSVFLPPGISFNWDLNLVNSGVMSIDIVGVDDPAALAITAILRRCFREVEPRGTRERRFVEQLEAKANPAGESDIKPGISQPVKKTPSPLERLIMVFDTERDPYMEWHDGPSLYEVDNAVHALGADDLATAAVIAAERLARGYDPYLGRAAELLNTTECRRRLDESLSMEKNSYTAAGVARNLLSMGRSVEAIRALQAIIENNSLDWYIRINALVNLKIAMDSAGGRRPVSEFITPELESVIFDAIEDDDYLVRYHAAETLLKAAGDTTPLPDHGELFGFICGKHITGGPLDEADRGGFSRAAGLLRSMMKKPAESGGTFAWPRFNEPVEITAGRTWTAEFESYDQRNDACYYVVSLHEKGALAGRLMACVDIGWAGDDWTVPSFASRIKSSIHLVASSGKTNTPYTGPPGV